MDQLVTIDVLGQPFSFKTDSDIAEARAIADYLAATVGQVKTQCGNQAPTPDKRAILLLAALNITSEYFELKKRHRELLDHLDQRSAHLIDALDMQLNLNGAHAVST